MSHEAALPNGPRAPAVLQLLRYTPHPAEFLEECAGKFGTPFTMRLAGFGTFVMLAEPQSVRDVFQGGPSALHSGEANEFLATTVGRRSLLVLDEEAHAAQRRALLPPFHGGRMRAHIARMRRATEESLVDWPVDRPFPIDGRMREITLRAILEVVLGIDEATTAPIRGDFERLLDWSRLPFALVLARVSPHRLLRRMRFLPFYRELHRIEDALRAHVRQRRERVASGSVRDDVLDDLLGARHADGRALDDDEIRDALMTMLVAGHDTTAVALAWVFQQILEHPGVVERIRDEVRRVAPDGIVAAEQLERLEYTDAVLRESLRRCTVVPFVTRRTTRSFRAGGHDYPAGIHLCPCSHLVHLDPELYPQPRSYRPERFLERRFAAHEWFPFGGGDRLCIGIAFALAQMKIVVATLLANADLRRPDGAASRRVRRGILIAPSDGTQVVLTRRASL